MTRLTIIFIFSLLLNACNNISLIEYSDDETRQVYCYRDIKDALHSKTEYKTFLSNSNYNRINKENLQKLLKSNDNGREQLNKFTEESHDIETFLITNKATTKKILLLIGKANGATGTGVDYWNYRTISVEEDEPMLEFSSLIKTPHSIFINNTGGINHIEVDDNYPRPANGEEVHLDHFPVLVNVFNGKNKEIEFSLKCKSEN